MVFNGRLIIKSNSNGGVTNVTGRIVINNVPNGEQTIKISMIGYRTVNKDFSFPFKTVDSLSIYMEPESEELEDVQVTATRSSRVITDIHPGR